MNSVCIRGLTVVSTAVARGEGDTGEGGRGREGEASEGERARADEGARARAWCTAVAKAPSPPQLSTDAALDDDRHRRR